MSTGAEGWVSTEQEQGEKERLTQGGVPIMWLLQNCVVLVKNRLAQNNPIGAEDNISGDIIANDQIQVGGVVTARGRDISELQRRLGGLIP